LLPDVGHLVFGYQVLAVIEGNDGAEHSLILSMGLAEVEARHDLDIIGTNTKTCNGTEVPSRAC